MRPFSQKLTVFIIVPVLTNLLLMGFYFSGSPLLQQIIAPTIEHLPPNSWREYGLLEQLQNIYLLVTIIIFVSAFVVHKDTLAKAFFLSLTILFSFILMEEIDYGIHFLEIITGEGIEQEVRNWHNQGSGGHDNVDNLKQFADLLTIIWFVVMPFLRDKVKIPAIYCLLPSRFFAAGFILIFFLSSIAHLLEDLGWGVINNQRGNISGNMSEFREHNTYYLYMLYAFQLFRSKLTLHCLASSDQKRVNPVGGR